MRRERLRRLLRLAEAREARTRTAWLRAERTLAATEEALRRLEARHDGPASPPAPGANESGEVWLDWGARCAAARASDQRSSARREALLRSRDELRAEVAAAARDRSSARAKSEALQALQGALARAEARAREEAGAEDAARSWYARAAGSRHLRR